MTHAMAAPGQLIGERYRLERPLTDPASAAGDSFPALGQGILWLARDQLAAEALCALRQLGPGSDQARARDLWRRLQAVLHPQVPRFGAVLEAGADLWLVREWQVGRTYGEMLAARAERQLVFGAGEVLLLLRQLLPVLAALHGQELLHGDLSPHNLLRRDSDGLPVLLDFGLVRGTSCSTEAAVLGATPGYAPPELLRGDPAEAWMDLHALGVVALVLLSGDRPADLLDPVNLSWRWPVALEAEPSFQEQLMRLLERDPNRRFPSAAQALAAFQALAMPDSTGPVARADRTLLLAPPQASEFTPSAVAALQASVAAAPLSDPSPASAVALPPTGGRRADGPTTPPPPVAALPPLPVSREQEREEASEGGVWPVLLALVISAVLGTALGWWWLGRGQISLPNASPGNEASGTLPPGEVDQRQQLLDRLRALQIDRGWFLGLIDTSLLAQYPERRGRLPGDSLEDAPLRRVWNNLAEEWLPRVEQLPLGLRQRLGGFQQADWERRQQDLLRQGISASVLRHLVSANAQHLLPGRPGSDIPPEPYRQLWYAAADQVLQNLRIEPIQTSSASILMLSAEVPASGARLFPIRLPPSHGLALGVNGSPLLQMSVYAADGSLLESSGPLRVVSLPSQKSSPVQLLVTNDGVAQAPIRLSLRADPPAPGGAGTNSPLPSASPSGLPAPAPASPTPVPAESAPATPAAEATPGSPPATPEPSR